MQNYIFVRTNNGVEEAIRYLKPNGKNLFGIFREALEKVQENIENEDLPFKELCRALVELPRPIPVDVITAATSYNCEKLASVCSEYLIGLYYHNGEITFRDEDFETYLRDTIKDGDTVVSKIAEILFNIRQTSYYANKHMHLFMIKDENIDILLDSIYQIRDIEISILEDEVNYILSKRIESAFSLDVIIDKRYREDVIKLLYIKTKCTEKDSSIKELIKNNLELANLLDFDTIINSSLDEKGNCSSLKELTFQCYKNTLLKNVDKAEEYFRLSKSKIRIILDTNDSMGHRKEYIQPKDIEYIAAYYAINVSIDDAIQWLNGWKPKCVEQTYRVIYLLLLLNRLDEAEEFIYKASDIDRLAASIAAFIDSNRTIKLEYILRVNELVESIKGEESKNIYRVILSEYLLKIGMKKEARLTIENMKIILDGSIFSFDTRDGRIEVEYIFRLYVLKSFLDNNSFSFEEFWIYNQLDKNLNIKDKKERYEEVQRVVNFVIESFKLRVRQIDGDDSKPKFEDFKMAYEGFERGIYQLHNDYNSYSYYRINCINIIPILLNENINTVREYCDKFLNNKYLNYDFHFNIAKLLVLSSEHKDLAPWYIYKLEQKEKRNPMDSTTLRDFYVKCSKTIYFFEQQLSKEYFKKALESTNLVDYDIYHRMNLWQNISEKYINDKDSCELVYNFTRIIEDAYKRLDDSKNLPIDSILKLLSRIEPSAAIASACRLEDRELDRVLGFENTIPIILDELLVKNIIEPEVAIAISNLDIEQDIKYDSIIRTTLDKLNEENENTESIIRVITEDIEKLSSGYSSKVEIRLLDEWNTEYKFIDIENLSQKYRYIAKVNLNHLSTTLDDKEKYTPWKQIEKELIIYTKDGVESLLRIISYNEKIEAIEYIMQNCKYSKKMSVIKNLIELVYSSKVIVKLNEFNKLLLDYILELREYNHEVKTWFSDEYNLEWFIELYYDKSYINESYIKEISEIFTLNNDVVISKLIRKSKQYLKKEDWKIYYVIRDLSKLYDENECSNILKWCCEEEIVNVHENSTDEVYSNLVEDKFTIQEAIAMYIIKMLGHTKKKNRWYAIHSIYNLFRMNNIEIIENIFKFIWMDIPRLFRDKSYVYFKDSAITYFLIALSRIAVDDVTIISGFIPKLLDIAMTDGVINILHRSISKEIVEKVYSDDIVIKTCCNVVKKEKIKINKYNNTNEIQTKYRFDFMDVVPYEYELLGDIFGKSSNDVVKDCDNIIASWKLSNNDVDEWNELYRSREIQQGAYGYNTSIEDLDKYIQYNAMFYVADLYRRTESEAISYYGDEESFEDWLNKWLPNNDGHWLYEIKSAPPNISQFLDIKKYVCDEEYYIEDKVFDNIMFYKEEEKEYVLLDLLNRINYHQSDKRYSIKVGLISINNLPKLQEESSNINYFIEHNFRDKEDDDDILGIVESIIDDSYDMESIIEKYDPYIKGVNTYNININNKLEKFLKLDNISPIKYCLSEGENYPIKEMHWGYEDSDRLYNLESNGRILMIKKKELVKYLETRKDMVIVFQVDISFRDSYNCHNAKSKAKDRRKIIVMNNSLTDRLMELEVKILDKYL